MFEALTSRMQKNRAESGFSLTEDLLADLLAYAKPLGHNEDKRTLNIGFGFLYYGLARAIRPKHVVVIGSGYGFSVTCLALGLKDNGKGTLTFIDPSYSVLKDGPFRTMGGQNFWGAPEEVSRHFGRFGVSNVVRHIKAPSEDVFAAYKEHGLPPIDLAFIDGNHSLKNVKHDFTEVVRHSHKNSYIFLHDTNIYIRETLRHSGVRRWLKVVDRQKKAFEVVDFPFASGVALVRVISNKGWDTSQ